MPVDTSVGLTGDKEGGKIERTEQVEKRGK
jgi:hypothetical protein